MDRRILFHVMALAAIAGCTRENAGDIARLAPRSGAPASAPARDAPPAPAAEPASRLLPSPELLTDTVITARVQASVLGDPALTGADVSVNTSQGVVSLTGLVASQEQAALASAHAQRQDGVMRVDNHLAVNLH